MLWKADDGRQQSGPPMHEWAIWALGRSRRTREPVAGVDPGRRGRISDAPTVMAVLIVEDDDDLRDLLAAMLEEEGFEVDTARHGEEALERASERMPDVILLDMKMPVMDGWTFAEEFELRYGRAVPIVVMTAAEHAAHRALEIGAAGWISKPFRYEQLVELLRSHRRA
jgi:CheY-like chemotaxis protein